jgi:hypothetical protein
MASRQRNAVGNQLAWPLVLLSPSIRAPPRDQLLQTEGRRISSNCRVHAMHKRRDGPDQPAGVFIGRIAWGRPDRTPSCVGRATTHVHFACWIWASGGLGSGVLMERPKTPSPDSSRRTTCATLMTSLACHTPARAVGITPPSDISTKNRT